MHSNRFLIKGDGIGLHLANFHFGIGFIEHSATYEIPIRPTDNPADFNPTRIKESENAGSIRLGGAYEEIYTRS